LGIPWENVVKFRERFEPHLLSPLGAHLNAELCRKAWDEDRSTDARLNAEFERAIEWLSRKGKRKNMNRRVGTSYRLKHDVEGYFRELGIGVYIPNGVFLMAAHYLGFRLEKYEARYGGIWDCWNAYLNISSKRLAA
jgi:hypothetical protein